jgi:hypothetical protein
MAITSKDINLVQLDKELGGQGLVADFNDPDNKLILPADNSTISEYELEAAIKAHVAQPTEADAKAAQRQALLERLGITESEAQLLLGGK